MEQVKNSAAANLLSRHGFVGRTLQSAAVAALPQLVHSRLEAARTHTGGGAAEGLTCMRIAGKNRRKQSEWPKENQRCAFYGSGS